MRHVYTLYKSCEVVKRKSKNYTHVVDRFAPSHISISDVNMMTLIAQKGIINLVCFYLSCTKLEHHLCHHK